MEGETTTTPPVVEDKGGQQPPTVTPLVAKGGTPGEPQEEALSQR